VTGSCLDDAELAAVVDGVDGAAAAHAAACPQCRARVEVARRGHDATLAPLPLDRPGAVVRGRAIGRYLALSLLGRGGMGVVVAAYDPELDRRVAVKVIGTSAAGDVDSDGPLRLVREAKAMAQLSHPNVVTVFDAGACDDGVFIAMELVEGTTLGRWRETDGRTWREIVAAYVAAGRGLAAAHEAGLVHRDFKPDNVLVSAAGLVKVTDFGLVTGARLDDSTTGADDLGARAIDTVDLTATGAIMGTPRYMAPEQFAARAVDARSDQFSFCAALYEALWRTPPFAGATFAAIAAAVTAGELQPPPVDEVPATLRAAVMRGLARHPDDRHASMAALLAILDAPPGRRRRWRWALGGGAAAAAAGIAVLALRGGGPPTCAVADDLDGAWTPAARAELTARFAEVAPAFGAATAGETVAALDAFAATWAEQRAAACRASGRGELDRRAADRARTCLARRQVDAAALIAALRRADRVTVALAGAAVGRLPDLATCADSERLGRRPVPAPSARAAVASAERALATARAAFEAGHYLDADAALAPLASSSAALGFAPLDLEVELLRSDLARELGDLATARDAARAALARAVGLGVDDDTARAWLALARAEGETATGDTAELAAEIGYRLAQRGEQRQLAFELGDLRQRHAINAGHLEEAAAIERELATVTGELAVRSWRVRATRAATQAAALRIAGRLDEAYRAAETSRAEVAAALGEAHPELWNAEYRLATIAFARGEATLAARWLASVRTRLAAAAIASAPIVTVLSNAAILDSELGRDGSPALEQAQAIADQVLPPDALDRLWIRYARGLHAFDRHDLPAARDHFEAVVLAVRGRAHGLEASAYENLGKVESRLGDFAAAESALTRAIALREVEDPGSLALALARSALGRVFLDRGQAARALPLLTRSLEARPPSSPAEEVTRAELRLFYALAHNELDQAARADAELAEAVTVLRDRGEPYYGAVALYLDADRRRRSGDRVGARASARDARQRFTALDLPDDARSVDDWLAEHRLR